MISSTFITSVPISFHTYGFSCSPPREASLQFCSP
nr:MAG TPA: hypothetical protein [Caudoviricetes sp.]